MSSIVNKVKEALSSDKTTHEQPEGTHGTHNTRAANAADPRIDSDRDHRAAHNTTTGGIGNTHTTPGHTTHTTGTHVGAGNNYSSTPGTNLGQTSHSQAYDNTDGPATKTDGPHKSNLLNKADPRVDSDRDHSKNLGANPHGTSGTGAYDVNQTTRGGEFGSNTTHTGGLGNTHATHGNTTHTGGLGTSAHTHGTSAHTGGVGHSTGGVGHSTGGIGGIGSNTAGHSSGLPEGTAGHHNSRVANAADPRIDSDLDGSNRHQGTHTGAGGFGSSTTHGTSAHTGALGSNTGGLGHNTTTHNTHGTSGNTAGLGSSTGGVGHGTTTHETSGLGHNTGGLGHNTTTHNTHGNTAHTGGLGSSTTAAGGHTSGPAPNTTGPHKSDMLNKLDPRVDSNLDGSKTYGGDKTFQQSNESSAYTHKDPTDAAQVPPSVMQQHIGAPTVAHDKHDHEHARRHSVSHQEQHRGL
ncbi:hypothetical protein AK830_g9505 [Neonectria ditissima]|uniref:Cell surface protein n=1 Tax=Neonectria ditissima TaxID=78410 RepID=A0A0P7B8Z8_9HYPO|nr:hypothetical protein AK830_g9505 [Neonectria ditissima]